jgi:hypothetical protein
VPTLIRNSSSTSSHDTDERRRASSRMSSIEPDGECRGFVPKLSTSQSPSPCAPRTGPIGAAPLLLLLEFRTSLRFPQLSAGLDLSNECFLVQNGSLSRKQLLSSLPFLGDHSVVSALGIFGFQSCIGSELSPCIESRRRR